VKLDTVIVGGGITGGRLARELAAAGAAALVVSAEDVPPYDRTRLSKDIFRGELAALYQASREQTRAYDLLLGRRAVELDAGAKQLSLDDGTAISYGRLVLATGLRPRRLERPGHDLDGVHYLRSLRDALAIERLVDLSEPLVIIGAGLIGCEMAAALAAAATPVVVVDSAAEPLASSVGLKVGRRIRDAHERAGISFRTSDSVDTIVGIRRVKCVRLASGDEIPAATVVIAIGGEPETDWLAGSGMALRDGYVPVDGEYRTSLPDVYAVGDITVWTHPSWGPIHVEHESVAHAQALGLARHFLLGERPRPATPYAWSDQAELRLRVIGHLSGPADASQVCTRMIDSTDTGFVAAFVRSGVVEAAASVNDDRSAALMQKLLRHGPISDSEWLAAVKLPSSKQTSPVCEPARPDRRDASPSLAIPWSLQ